MASCGATLEIKTEICMISNVCRRVSGCADVCRRAQFDFFCGEEELSAIHNYKNIVLHRWILINAQSTFKYFIICTIRIGWTVLLLHFPCSLSPHPPPYFSLTLPVYQTVVLVSVMVSYVNLPYAKTKTGVLQIIFLMFSILTQGGLLSFHLSLYGTNVFELSLDGRKCSHFFGKLN